MCSLVNYFYLFTSKSETNYFVDTFTCLTSWLLRASKVEAEEISSALACYPGC